MTPATAVAVLTQVTALERTLRDLEGGAPSESAVGEWWAYPQRALLAGLRLTLTGHRRALEDPAMESVLPRFPEIATAVDTATAAIGFHAERVLDALDALPPEDAEQDVTVGLREVFEGIVRTSQGIGGALERVGAGTVRYRE